MRILVTGGAGYIGTHTCVELLAAGHEVVIVDNLINSSVTAVERVRSISGKSVDFVEADCCDRAALDRIFAKYAIDAVIHFAGLKAVGESVAQPLRYYQNNVTGTLHLLDAMTAAGVKQLVFSSSATVYGDPASVPLREDAPLSATNPYGQSKLTIEIILRDLAKADPTWRICCLRYFNPVGAHVSGSIGEDPNGIPNNLVPFILQVAVGKRDALNIFGNDYPTRDGTGVRDYIHVVDLARGHLAALEHLADLDPWVAINLGTGTGTTVIEMVDAVSAEVGKKLPYRVVARRPGDIAACYADPALAERLLGWRAQLGIADMCRDGWRWQSTNPNGYKG
jgi:UDP-glucose 4-epimerase